MKRIVSLFLSFVMLCSVFGAGTAAFAAGKGTLYVTASEGGSFGVSASGSVTKISQSEYECAFNTEFTLTAESYDNYAFDGWYDSSNNLLSTANPYTFTFPMESEYTVKGVFKATTVQFGIMTENGTATPSEVKSYVPGTTITITATPSPGYVFDGWYDGGTLISKENPTTYTVNKQGTIEAKFTQNTTLYPVTVTFEGKGKIDNTGGDVQINYPFSVTATPAEGYYFDGWYEDGTKIGSATTLTYNVTKAVSLKAVFKALPTYTVTIIVDGEGNTAVSGKNYEGGQVTVTAIPETGATFKHWKNGSTVITDNPYTFTITENTSLTAVFEQTSSGGGTTPGNETTSGSTTPGGTTPGGSATPGGSTVPGGNISVIVSDLETPAIKKVKAGKKRFTLTWKTVKGVNGYTIQYATNKKFTKGLKTVTVKNAKTAKKVIKKLKKGKKYYVRIRAFKGAQNSKWSKVKSVKAK